MSVVVNDFLNDQDVYDGELESAPDEPRRDAVVLTLPVKRVETTPTVSVIIPTLNEVQNIGFVLDRIPESVDEVIIVDGLSTDGTLEFIWQNYPDVRTIDQDGRGKGNALQCGFAAARGDIVVTLDADGSTDPLEIESFVAALTMGADYAKGTRFSGGGGSSDISLSRRFGNGVLRSVVNRLFCTNFTDLCYGYNAFWRRHLLSLDIDCSGFEVETLMNLRAIQASLVVVEVPSFESERRFGHSNLSTFRDGWRVLRTIVAERKRVSAAIA